MPEDKSRLPIEKKSKGIIVNDKGTRMVKVGEYRRGFQTTNLKNLG